MNAADLQKLLDEATPGPLSFSKRGQRIYGGKTGGVNIAQINLNPQFEPNGRGMAMWQDLARRVIAAERLVEAIRGQRDMACQDIGKQLAAENALDEALSEWGAAQ